MSRETRRSMNRSADATAQVKHGTGWSLGPAAFGGLAVLFLPIVLVGPMGCGSNIQGVLFQTAGAAGRTYLDLLLTDVANAVAERFDREPGTTPPVDGGAGGEEDADGADGGGGDTGGRDSTFEGLTGNPASGESLYASCTACHCADASGGCLAGASPVVGASAETLDEFLRGGATHVHQDLTDQEIVDLETYLTSLGE